jgi:prepilin-type N-terminal cleavage/methylation domain-containing protein
MKQRSKRTKHSGFTLIEVMVATALFVVVVTIGIGSILSVTRAHRYTSELRQGFDTLYFVMEDITRNVRLGTVFRSSDSPLPSFAQDFPVASNGLSGSSKLVFTNYLAPRVTDYQIDPDYLYVYQIADLDGDGKFSIVKTTNEGTFSMTSSAVVIDPVLSGFSVVNAGVYPLITIRLAGTINYQSTTIPFNIETSISPRTL